MGDESVGMGLFPGDASGPGGTGGGEVEARVLDELFLASEGSGLDGRPPPPPRNLNFKVLPPTVQVVAVGGTNPEPLADQVGLGPDRHLPVQQQAVPPPVAHLTARHARIERRLDRVDVPRDPLQQRQIVLVEEDQCPAVKKGRRHDPIAPRTETVGR
jgi:hypothetical protein